MKNNTIASGMIPTLLLAITTLCILASETASAQNRSENQARSENQTRPNILFRISDDQSYAHTDAAGDPVVQTPPFDRVAREGLRFTHAFCDAPTCGPSRSAVLTGQPIWRLPDLPRLLAKSREYPDR